MKKSNVELAKNIIKFPIILIPQKLVIERKPTLRDFYSKEEIKKIRKNIKLRKI